MCVSLIYKRDAHACSNDTCQTFKRSDTSLYCNGAVVRRQLGWRDTATLHLHKVLAPRRAGRTCLHYYLPAPCYQLRGRQAVGRAVARRGDEAVPPGFAAVCRRDSYALRDRLLHFSTGTLLKRLRSYAGDRSATHRLRGPFSLMQAPKCCNYCELIEFGAAVPGYDVLHMHAHGRLVPSARRAYRRLLHTLPY